MTESDKIINEVLQRKISKTAKNQLQEGWCRYIKQLKQIKIQENNSCYSKIEYLFE